MKTALITGASRGIGRAIAMACAQQGWQVALGCLHALEETRNLAQTINARGGRALALQADVSDSGQVEEMFSAAEGALGPVELLFNNAGVAQQKLFTSITDEDWDHMFDVDVKGVFLCCRRALPSMIAAKRGVIVNLSSIWGLAGASCEVHYSAAKAAVIGLTKALAKEVGPSGVRVNCLAPGVIATDMNAGLAPQELEALRQETPLGRIGSPEDVARAAVFLASEEAGFITGQVLSPNGGFVI